jgi:hypothetical protein
MFSMHTSRSIFFLLTSYTDEMFWNETPGFLDEIYFLQDIVILLKAQLVSGHLPAKIG